MPNPTLATASVATILASLNSPLNNRFIAVPNLGINSNNPSNLFIKLFFKASTNSINASLGLENALNKNSPNLEITSDKFPTITPNTFIILLSEFCPSSLDVKYDCKALKANTKAAITTPIGVAINASVALVNPCIPDIKPPKVGDKEDKALL